MKKNIHIQNKLTIIDQDSLGLFLNNLKSDKQCSPLTPEMEKALFAEYRLSKSHAICERIVKANLRWVVTIAKQFSYPKARLEDLINEGAIGLQKAVPKFNPDFGNGFLTFATWYIRQEISHYINHVLADIAQPDNRYRINKLMSRVKQNLQSAGNVTPSMEEMIAEYDNIKEGTDPIMTVAFYNEILTQTKGFVSMCVKIGDVDSEEMNLEHTFKSGYEYAPDYSIAQQDKAHDINVLLNTCLTLREKEIIEFSFGLNNHEEKTLEQIAEILGLTRERVGQLKDGALCKLKTYKGKVYELCGNAKETSQVVDTFIN